MGASPYDSPDLPDIRFAREVLDPSEPVWVPPIPVMPRREPRTKYAILFLLTLLTTSWAGMLHYESFVVGFSDRTLDMPLASLMLRGLWYGASILAILGAHEFGHYFACRYYRVDASLPYFIPVPLPLTGTLGAVIRIRQMIPGKRPLFDIGIAGPIAGFVVAVPLLVIGMMMSTLVRIPPEFNGTGAELGEPLLYKAVEWLVFGRIPDGADVNLHPMAFAAWFGLLATALNLFPIGQLDGGHISYAVLGRKSTYVTFATVACLVGLTFVSTSWLVWAVLTIGMLIAFGPRHPRTYDEHIPLDRPRLWLALFAALMFILCFSPAPIKPMDIVGSPAGTSQDAEGIDVHRHPAANRGHL